MKTFIGVVILVIVMGVLVQMKGTDTTYVKEDTVEVQQEETKEKWQTDEEAIQAAKDVVKKKELQAELEKLDIEIKEKQEKRKQVATELNAFWTRENVKALIRKTFPEDPVVAVAVADCESGLKPTAYNPINKDGSTDGGLWQINSTHDKRLEELGLNKFDPEDATKFARILYDNRGFNDWVCYTKNKIVMR